MKKEVSDHLAKVFLEARPAQKNKKERSFFAYIVISCAVITVLVLITAFLAKNKQGLAAKSEVLRLERSDGPRVLKFDFTKDRTSSATLFIGLPDANLNRYKKVGFNIRILEPQTSQKAALKVSIVSKRKEISSLYIRQVNNHWKQVVVPFSLFGNVSDWSGVAGISFSLEPWNAVSDKGRVLIDDIQFFKN